MTDDLESRLRAADPAGHHGATPSSPASIRELMEDTMQTTDETQTPDTGRSAMRPGPRWLVAAAVVAVLALGGAGAAQLLSTDNPTPSANPQPSLVLSLPDSDAMSSCIQFSVDILAGMPTAFSGTALSTAKGTVLLEVDTWYRGGDAEVVALRNPENAMTSIDGVEFVDGERYLVTASETGTVNSCGFTALWTPTMAAAFEDAFGR